MPPSPQVPSGHIPPVLIVDNEQSVAALLLETLARLRIAAEWVGDGRRVAERVADLGVSLVVCDLDMPGFSGEQVVDTLALLERPPKVLVITGFAMPDVGERLRRIPCVVDLLVKPFDVLKFGRRIQAMLAEDVRGRSEPPREQGATLF